MGVAVAVFYRPDALPVTQTMVIKLRKLRISAEKYHGSLLSAFECASYDVQYIDSLMSRDYEQASVY